MPDDSMLTTGEAGEITKLSPYTIRSVIRSGELRAYKLGGQWRVKREDLDAWVERGLYQPQSSVPDRGWAPAPRSADSSWVALPEEDARTAVKRLCREKPGS